MIRQELRRMCTWEERHRRLVARITIAFVLTLIVDAIATFLMWEFERDAYYTDIHSLGDALFFSTVQLLTISSQMKNPVSNPGRIVDVVLEIWAVVVVSSIGGSFASFFSSGDRT